MCGHHPEVMNLPLPARFRAVAVAVPVLLSAFVAPAAATADPGVEYQSFTMTTSHGTVVGHVLTVDLRQARLDLLHPGVVAARDEVPDMADAQGAVAGVNGDFFNISETHEGVEPTNSAVGPAIAAGAQLKGAVPNGQRFGPGLPAGTSTRDVLAVGVDGIARVSTLELRGVARTSAGTFDIEGLNQYALAENGIGVFTGDWGPMSRVRATCGTDTERNAPCSAETEEILVRNGIVVAERDEPGEGALRPGTMALVGREGGDAELEALDPGDRVALRPRLVAEALPPLAFAVGGFPILRDGTPLSDLDATTLAPRTVAGVSADGRTVHLVVVDGRSEASVGMTVAETAELLSSFGAVDGVNLDGGGSSTLVSRDPGAARVTVRNAPSDGAPRAVANGVGVFAGA